MVNKEILDSWKEISNYMGKDIRTCYRWEKELDLPVHRIDSDSIRSKVFAYRSEIDEWLSAKAKNNCAKKQLYKNKYFILSIILLCLVVLSVFTFLYFGRKDNFYRTSNSLSMVIFPLRNLVNSINEDYFSLGITNELINQLSKQNNLKVIAAKGENNFGNGVEDRIYIGKKYKADLLMIGSVEKNEKYIGLNLNIFETKKGTCIWNNEFEEPFNRLNELKDKICSQIYENLYIETNQTQTSSNGDKYLNNHEAFDNYMKGKFLLDKIQESNDDPWEIYYQGQFYSNLSTQENNELAIELFSKVIEIDSSFAPAYIGLANCYTAFINFGWESDSKWLSKAIELLERSQKISPGLPEYYSTLAQIYLIKDVGYQEDLKEEAFKLAEEGIKKYPNHPKIKSKIAFYYYLKFGETGIESFFEKSIDHMQESFMMNPHSIGNIFFAELLMLNAKYNDALYITDHISSKSPSLKYRIAEIYYYMGEIEKSRLIFTDYGDILQNKLYSLSYLGMIAAQEGNFEEAKKILKEIDVLAPQKEASTGFHLQIASIYMGIGDFESGYVHLEKAFSAPDTAKLRYIYQKFIDIDKNFNKFKDEKRFNEIILGGKSGKKQVSKSNT